MDKKKEVYFHQYCKTCIYWQNNEAEYPCDYCLENGSNIDSHKPVYYKKNEKCNPKKFA